MIRLLLLAPQNSIHTKKWVQSLSQMDFEILLFSLHSSNDCFYDNMNNLKICSFNFSIQNSSFSLRKINYLRVIRTLKRKIKEFKPDIIHSHYASSYGLIGALTHFHPYIISVWGSDVYIFPKKTLLHNIVIRYSFLKADNILSTSGVMANEIKKYTKKRISITPFGVDVNLFKKNPDISHTNPFIIGIVKSLEPIYGIDTLIKAFKIVTERNQNQLIKLLIIGSGSEKKKLMTLCNNLGIENVEFLGHIDNENLPAYYNLFSVCVFPSISESFGVACIESMSCGCPVISSDADGYKEILTEETGFIIKKNDIDGFANAIQKFIDDSSLRYKLGKRCRERVEKLYNWDRNVEQMVAIYRNLYS